MARLFLAAPDLRASAWTMNRPRFSEALRRLRALRRDALRCSAEKDDAALIRSEAECRSLEAASIAYIRKQREFSGPR